MNKVIYILSGVEKAVAFEWIVKRQSDLGIELVFVLLNKEKDCSLYQFLIKEKTQVYFVPLHSKKTYLTAFLSLLSILKKEKPDIVHTHLLFANILGLLAAYLLRVSKRIYTRHHSTFVHDYYPKIKKYDRIINFLSTDIIAISNNVKSVLVGIEKVNENKIKLVEHGFNFEEFQNISFQRVDEIKRKHNIPKDKYVIGCISRYLILKGHKYIIKAFKHFLKKYPNSFLVLANSRGPDIKTVKELLLELPEDSYTEIEFEEDLFALYQTFDLFVHVPINREIEAFGQTYVEALIAGIPSVFTLSGIANDFVKDGENALVVDYKSETEIYQAFRKLNENKTLSNNLRVKGQESVSQFSLDNMIEKLREIYN